jgi:hypothetical protein
VKGPRDEVVTIRFENQKFVITQTTKYDEIMASIKSAAGTCGKNSHGNSSVNACIAKSVAGELHSITESKTLLAKYRDQVSERLRNYVCSDHTLETTASVSTFPIRFRDGKRLTGVKLFCRVQNFALDGGTGRKSTLRYAGIEGLVCGRLHYR